MRAKKNKTRAKKSGLLKLLIPLLIFVLIFLFLKFYTRFWDGKDKVSVLSATKNGGAIVSTYDPGSDEIIDIIIPGETQVDVARELGVRKIDAIPSLGANEKIGGVLLSETIIKNFKFPVFVWQDATGKTNQALGDKFNIAVFSIGKKHTEINLSETSYLKKTKLKDGSDGFVLNGKLPEKIAAIFADPEASKTNLKINIKDATGTFGVAKKVGEIIEVLGAKTALVTSEKPEESVCNVSGKNEKFTRKVARIFECKLDSKKLEGGFDLEIKLGQNFAKRF